jgi:prepilin-type N-terminal cleavage/methylation domain-containing protein
VLKKSRGVTLVEMIIAMAIMGVLLSLALPSF